LIKNSQPFGKKFQKTVRGIFLTHTVLRLSSRVFVISAGHIIEQESPAVADKPARRGVM